MKKTIKENVMDLMERFPSAKRNYKILILAYWINYDGINLSSETVKEILFNGTEPETINRAKRLNNRLLLDSASFADQVEEFIKKTNES